MEIGCITVFLMNRRMQVTQNNLQKMRSFGESRAPPHHITQTVIFWTYKMWVTHDEAGVKTEKCLQQSPGEFAHACSAKPENNLLHFLSARFEASQYFGLLVRAPVPYRIKFVLDSWNPMINIRNSPFISWIRATSWTKRRIISVIAYTMEAQMLWLPQLSVNWHACLILNLTQGEEYLFPKSK